MRRLTLLSCLVVAVIAGLTGIAFGVSDGNYDPAKQDCSPSADAYNRSHSAEPGCHALKINVGSGDTRYAEFGIDQVPDGRSDISYGLGGVAAPGRDASPHDGCFAVNTNGTGGGPGTGCGSNPDGVGIGGTYDLNPLFGSIAAFVFGPDGDEACHSVPVPSTDPNCHPVPEPPADPAGTIGSTGSITPSTGNVDTDALSKAATELNFYMGADDNLDAGEHDGVDGFASSGTDKMPNGPSDGGAIVANWHPLEVMSWVAAAMSGDTAYLLNNPLPIADAGIGACADSICVSAQSRSRDVYNGTGNNGRSRNVANYDGKEWDPDNCSSGSAADEAQCHDATHSTMNDYRDAEADHVYAAPGVTYYEDPDPQGSPLSKVPHTAVYAGTCGVILGGGYAPFIDQPTQAPASPLTNNSGQLVISTGC